MRKQSLLIMNDEMFHYRLASLLISANPLEMTVCLPHSESGVRFVDEAFMKAYADSIFMPSLTVYLKYFEDDRLVRICNISTTCLHVCAQVS